MIVIELGASQVRLLGTSAPLERGKMEWGDLALERRFRSVPRFDPWGRNFYSPLDDGNNPIYCDGVSFAHALGVFAREQGLSLRIIEGESLTRRPPNRPGAKYDG
ncbi:hypothetical protein GS597_09155 [Synechococcales cyanobacterium C]|uniref:Uncharacterized protein n=1 Tax=Petrachloros mirabilis ULC683 TaxID=2781853 RepID=A0A8K2A821_9CYAN|nr:hypothetical protein [Petrachloros mirabilis]NCJ06670.1 hypothetical protein [Petrachloros mirabilis ULC683]